MNSFYRMSYITIYNELCMCLQKISFALIFFMKTLLVFIYTYNSTAVLQND